MKFGSPPLARAIDSGSGDRAFTTGEIDADAELVSPSSAAFSGFVFKLQANLNPKHRDRLAYVRICSGRFEKGMKVLYPAPLTTPLTLLTPYTPHYTPHPPNPLLPSRAPPPPPPIAPGMKV